jgi:hypothetical protein
VGIFEARQVRDESLRQPRGGPAKTIADPRHALGRKEELARRQEDDLVDSVDRPLVGRIESTEGVDLVAEELDADRQRARRWKGVEDAATAGELAMTGHLEDRHVATVEELTREPIERCSRARVQSARLRGQVVGRERVLDKGLDARDEDACAAALPCGERGHTRGRLVRHELAALIGEAGPRLEHRHRIGVAQPGAELFGHPIPDLGIAGHPHDSLACLAERECRREVGLGSVGNGDHAGMTSVWRWPIARRAQPFAERTERPG